MKRGCPTISRRATGSAKRSECRAERIEDPLPAFRKCAKRIFDPLVNALGSRRSADAADRRQQSQAIKSPAGGGTGGAWNETWGESFVPGSPQGRGRLRQTLHLSRDSGPRSPRMVRKDSDIPQAGFRTDSPPVQAAFSFAETFVKNLSKQTGWHPVESNRAPAGSQATTTTNASPCARASKRDGSPSVGLIPRQPDPGQRRR
jgi:hypothetical protein